MKVLISSLFIITVVICAFSALSIAADPTPTGTSSDTGVMPQGYPAGAEKPPTYYELTGAGTPTATATDSATSSSTATTTATGTGTATSSSTATTTATATGTDTITNYDENGNPITSTTTQTSTTTNTGTGSTGSMQDELSRLTPGSMEAYRYNLMMNNFQEYLKQVTVIYVNLKAGAITPQEAAEQIIGVNNRIYNDWCVYKNFILAFPALKSYVTYVMRNAEAVETYIPTIPSRPPGMPPTAVATNTSTGTDTQTATATATGTYTNTGTASNTTTYTNTYTYTYTS